MTKTEASKESKAPMEAPQIITPGWQVPSNVVAFTTTRLGGYSSGAFDSFNLGSHVRDNAGKVKQNRALLSKYFELPSEPSWLEQVHGLEVVDLDSSEHASSNNKSAIVADGSITARVGVVSVVMTADCLPLFICNAAGTKVAMVHAGWKGMANGVIEAAIAAFDEPVESIITWAGPTISFANFEIGPEVKEQLGGSEQAYWPSQKEDKFYANLYQLAGERLNALGVTSFGHSSLCTYGDEKFCFSYRRNGRTGRMASLIYLKY